MPRAGPPVNLDAERQVRDAHAHRLEEGEIGARPAAAPAATIADSGTTASMAFRRRPRLDELAREVAHGRDIVAGDGGAARQQIGGEFRALGRDRADGVDVRAGASIAARSTGVVARQTSVTMGVFLTAASTDAAGSMRTPSSKVALRAKASRCSASG